MRANVQGTNQPFKNKNVTGQFQNNIKINIMYICYNNLNKYMYQ